MIRVSEIEDGLCLLTKDFKEYMMSPDVFTVSLDDMLAKLPVKLYVVHFKKRITKLKHFSAEIV